MRSAVRVIFERFAVEPSARAVLRWAQATHFLMPTRQRGTSEVLCRPLGNLRLNNMLRNPAYAGVYVYGRHPTRKALVDGEIRKVRKAAWQSERVASTDSRGPSGLHHLGRVHEEPGEAAVEHHERCPRGTRRATGRAGAVPGIALCGRCGRRMSARYDSRASRWHYVCYGESAKGARLCWSVPGRAIDRAVEQLFLRTMVPSELELSLAVEREVTGQADSLDKAWHARIEQAQYEARRAERRYKAVDPDNRVVARTLEGEWENRLRDLEKVELERAQARRQHRIELGPEDQKRIRELAHDLPVVWAASTTSMADRKAMLRLVIEAIALHAVDVPERVTRVRVQWTSGAVSEFEVARPGCGNYHKHAPAALQRIRELAVEGNHDDQIARRLTAEGAVTGTGKEWNEERVHAARRSAGIERVAPDRPHMLPLPHQHPDGRYSVPGVMARFGVSKTTVHSWIRRAIVTASRADFGGHPNVYWIALDKATEARLKEMARDYAGRR